MFGAVDYSDPSTWANLGQQVIGTATQIAQAAQSHPTTAGSPVPSVIYTPGATPAPAPAQTPVIIQQGGGTNWWPIAIVGVAAIGLVAVVLLKRR